MPLHEAHGEHVFCFTNFVVLFLTNSADIGEALQDKLELLDTVERAFVHLDFETSHKPEHNRLRSMSMDSSETIGSE